MDLNAACAYLQVPRHPTYQRANAAPTIYTHPTAHTLPPTYATCCAAPRPKRQPAPTYLRAQGWARTRSYAHHLPHCSREYCALGAFCRGGQRTPIIWITRGTRGWTSCKRYRSLFDGRDASRRKKQRAWLRSDYRTYPPRWTHLPLPGSPPPPPPPPPGRQRARRWPIRRDLRHHLPHAIWTDIVRYLVDHC